MIKVMCAGTFDIVHPGHLYFLSESKKYGTRLVVVVARDSTSEKLKKRKPKNNERTRLEAIRSLDVVDEARLGNEGDIFAVIEEIKPNVICLGYDQGVSKERLEEELKKRNMKADVIRIGSLRPDIYKSSKMGR
ncbi:MAG TPA: adenylyltransferase/cytidyltransferase family protein [Candidatus Nanoarchaeia archaeon]|nr:adenylyltransferase/cytidyltransferase family protein [Candidatus Nanoarchaeia archaeon]